MKEIVLDTETTGISIKEGHRVVEIGCVEIENLIPTKRQFHCYLNPERKVSDAALKVHGYSDEFLSKQRKFNEIVEEFMEFISDSNIIIHNASFDVGFLNHELSLESKKLIADDKVIDTLVIARAKHPGMPNNLDALCKRYNIAEQKRGLHDAKSDCELLAQVYIELIGGRQSNLELHKDETNKSLLDDNVSRVRRERRPSQELTTEELDKHREFTKNFVKKALWSKKD